MVENNPWKGLVLISFLKYFFKISKFWDNNNLLKRKFALKSVKMLQITYFWTLFWPFRAKFYESVGHWYFPTESLDYVQDFRSGASYGTIQLWQAAVSRQNFLFPPDFLQFLDLIFLIIANIASTALFHMGFFGRFFLWKSPFLPSEFFEKNRTRLFWTGDSSHYTLSFNPD